MAKSETGRLLTPLSVAAALALVGAAWFVPFPKPSIPGEVVQIGPASGSGEDGSAFLAVGSMPDHNWLALAEPLRNLRDPVVKPEEQRIDIDPIPIRPPVSLRYLGFAGAGEDRVAALLDIEGTQRFVTVGQVIQIPDRDELRITEITPDKVVYEVGSVSKTLTRDRGGSSGGSPSPSPLTPPGVRPPSASEDSLRGEIDPNRRRDQQ